MKPANQTLALVLKLIPQITIMVEQIDALTNATTRKARTAAILEILIAGLMASEVVTDRDLLDDDAFNAAGVKVLDAYEAVADLVRPRVDPPIAVTTRRLKRA